MAMFSQRHYEWLAGQLADMLDRGIPRVEVNATAQHFAKALASDNPKFKQNKFLLACLYRNDKGPSK